MSSFDAFTVDDHHFASPADEDTYSGYGGYSSFQGDDVPVEHTTSPEIFGFSDPDPGYSQSPFENGNENGNGHEYSDGVFVSDGPVLPPPGEMEPEEGYVLREWRRQPGSPAAARLWSLTASFTCGSWICLVIVSWEVFEGKSCYRKL